MQVQFPTPRLLPAVSSSVARPVPEETPASLHFEGKSPDKTPGKLSRPTRLGILGTAFATALMAVAGMSAPVPAQDKPTQLGPATHAKVPETKSLSMEDLDKALKTTGLKGRIHGADPERRMYVFTYRDPENFFNNIQFSVISSKKEVVDVLKTLNRHDAVTLKGKIVDVENAQPHIRVESIVVNDRFKADVTAPGDKFHKTAKLPDELMKKTEATFLVHAIANEGKVLVVEYKDDLVMVVVPDNAQTKSLWRGDRVTLNYTLQEHPKSPAHLILDTSKKEPVKVEKDFSVKKGDKTEALSFSQMHGQPIVHEGLLVRFPKSPAINRDIWAVEQKASDGTSRYFTLVNFEDKDGLDRIDKHVRAMWDSTPKDAVIDGRNKLINTQVRIQVKGTLNIEDPNQANAQIFLTEKGIERLKTK